MLTYMEQAGPKRLRLFAFYILEKAFKENSVADVTVLLFDCITEIVDMSKCEYVTTKM